MKQIFYNHLVRPVADTFFPPVCFLCNRLQSEPGIICTACWNQMQFYTEYEIRSYINHLDKKLFEELFILFRFSDTVQQSIHLFKYKQCQGMGKIFAEKAFARWGRLKKNNYDLIIPVPLHRLKLKERGYNQSEKIASHLASLLNVELNTNTLERIRYTGSQSRLSKKERRKNVADAFKCITQPDKKRILLVDDVITTASTVNSCIEAISKVNENRVDVLVIATPPLYSQI